MPSEYDYSCLVAIDCKKRAKLTGFMFSANRNALRNAFRREPDYEDVSMISWGSVTLDEARRLAMLEDYAEDQAVLIRELEEFYARFPAAACSLYNCDSYRGQ